MAAACRNIVRSSTAPWSGAAQASTLLDINLRHMKGRAAYAVQRSSSPSSVDACAAPDQGAVEDRTMFLQAAAITYGAHKGYGRAKLPNAVHELGQALRVALADPGAELRWFRGEEVFAPLPDEG